MLNYFSQLFFFFSCSNKSTKLSGRILLVDELKNLIFYSLKLEVFFFYCLWLLHTFHAVETTALLCAEYGAVAKTLIKEFQIHICSLTCSKAEI